MSDVAERDIFRTQLIELLAYKTAEQLGDLQLPSAEKLEKYKEVAAPKADELIRAYERTLIAKEIREIVLKDLKKELITRARWAKILEIGLNISSLLVASMIGLSQFIFDPTKNAKEISSIYFVLLGVVAFQFVGNLFLRYVDEREM